MPESRNKAWHRPEREKACIACGESKPLGEFYAYGYSQKDSNGEVYSGTRYESRCKPCARARRRAQYSASPERDNRTSRAWRERNREQLAQKNKEVRSTEFGRARHAFYQRLRKARMRSNASDNQAIRAVYAEAQRLEAVIQDCPVFDLPELGKKLHVDHVVPLARGGKHVPDNLQILAKGLNLRKGARCPK